MLTWSSLKAYFRNRGAIFFSLLVPLMIMGIFGLINFGNSTPSVNIGVVDQAHNQVSDTIISNLRGIRAVKLHLGSLDAEKRELTQGNRDLVAVLPALMKNCAAQPAAKVGWRRAVENVSIRSSARCVVPARHHSPMASSLVRII